MHDLFSQVRERVTAKEAAEKYGIEVRRDFAKCPFHGEKTASLHFYGGRFHCFGCHAGGSSIDFTALLFSLDSLGAARKLNEDFSLGLDRPPTRADRQAARRREETARLHAQFEAWRQETTRRLNACIRTANRAQPPFSEAEELALARREALESWANALSWGTPEEQMEIYRMRKELEVCTQRILSDTPRK